MKNNQKQLEAFHVRSISLFGSVVRCDAGNDSDVDLLIDFEPDAKVGLFEFAGLQEFLRETLKRPVDIVTPDALHPALKDAILAEAVHVS